jgi:DNA-binding protein HU-beta
MTKADIVNKIMEDAGIKRIEAENAFTALLDTVTDALRTGDKVTLVGFGTFAVTERAERIGRNPRTGAELKIHATVAAKFTAGKDLKELVNKS